MVSERNQIMVFSLKGKPHQFPLKRQQSTMKQTNWRDKHPSSPTHSVIGVWQMVGKSQSGRFILIQHPHLQCGSFLHVPACVRHLRHQTLYISPHAPRKKSTVRGFKQSGDAIIIYSHSPATVWRSVFQYSLGVGFISEFLQTLQSCTRDFCLCFPRLLSLLFIPPRLSPSVCLCCTRGTPPATLLASQLLIHLTCSAYTSVSSPSLCQNVPSTPSTPENSFFAPFSFSCSSFLVCSAFTRLPAHSFCRLTHRPITSLENISLYTHTHTQSSLWVQTDLSRIILSTCLVQTW